MKFPENCESAAYNSEAEYFDARPQKDGTENKNIFNEGFKRGWEECEKFCFERFSPTAQKPGD
jgi:hypothetical protein